MVRVGPFPGIGPSELIRAMQSEPWNAPCPLPASGMPIAWRTRQERTFRMSHGQIFRMTAVPMKRGLRRALYIATYSSLNGHVAEWLRNGLQNRVPRFNSGRGLQLNH